MGAPRKRLTLEMGIEHAPRLLSRYGEANLRKQGRLRELVLALLRAGQDPSPTDLAVALRETPPTATAVCRVPLTADEQTILVDHPPADLQAWLQARLTEDRKREALDQAREVIAKDTALLCDYVARVYVLGRPRKTGRKGAPRSLADDQRIAAAYFWALERAKKAHDADSRRLVRPKDVKVRIAKQHRIAVRTLERIIRGMRARFS